MQQKRHAPLPTAISFRLSCTGSTRPDRSDRALIDWPRLLLRIFVITVREFRKNDLSLRADALTFAILLSLVPILAMSTAVVKGLGGDNHLRQTAYSYIAALEEEAAPADQGDATAAPETTLTGHLRSAADAVFDYVDQTNFATLGGIGSLALFLSVMLVLSHIETAMNVIWQVRAGRSFSRKISDYITLLVLMPLAINIGFAGSAFLKNPTLSAKLKALIPFLWLELLLMKMVPVVLIALALFVIYLFFPNTRVRSLPAFSGALLAAILWFVVQNLCISLQIGVSRYNAIYGSFATLPLLLIWIYFIWIFVLVGAQFAWAVQNRRQVRIAYSSATPSQKLDCTFAVMIEVQRAFAEQTPPTIGELQEILSGHDARDIEEAAARLLKAGLLHVSSSGGRLLPGAPAERISPARLVALVLEEDAADLPPPPAPPGPQPPDTDPAGKQPISP